MITRSALSPTRSTRSTRSALSPTLSCSTRSPCSAVSPLIRPAHSAPLRSRSQVDEKLKKEIDDGEGEAKGLETTVEANEGALAADEKVGKADEDDAAKEDTQQIDGRRECVAAEASVVDLPAAWFSGNPGLVAQAGGEATCKEKSTDDDDDDETETLFVELATAMCVQMRLCVCVRVRVCVSMCRHCCGERIQLTNTWRDFPTVPFVALLPALSNEWLMKRIDG